MRDTLICLLAGALTYLLVHMVSWSEPALLVVSLFSIKFLPQYATRVILGALIAANVWLAIWLVS